MGYKIGSQTIKLERKPRVITTTSIVGKKEGEGPLKDYFDIILEDDLNGHETYEQAESSILYDSISETIKKSRLKEEDVDFLFGGDLLNQLAASSFAARKLNIPFFGLYGACSTMTESLSLAALMVEAGFGKNVIAATSSHFSSSERQFRFPLEYGSQRAGTAQWTVTGSGSMLVSKNDDENYPYVSYVTTGKIKDYGISDPNNMGAAMAPAAVDTIKQHFLDTKLTPKDYDLIVTGDLGHYGKEITQKLLLEYGYDISPVYIDCGAEIFDAQKQNTLAGGSGCGCSAVVYCGYIYKKLMNKGIKRVLLVSTGALLSTTSSLQGETIPGIAHAVSIENGGNEGC